MQQNSSKILNILVILHSVLAREKNNRTYSDENAKEMFEHIDALNKRVQNKFGNDPRYLNMQKNVWSLFYDCIKSGGIRYCQEQNDNGSTVHIQNEKNRLEKNLNRTIEKIYQMKGEVRNKDINPEIERNKIKSDLASLVREVHDLLYKLFHSLVKSTGINCEEVEFEKDEIHEWIAIRNQKVDFIYPLCIATRAFCCLNPERTLDEEIENLLETIGFDMFQKFRHEFSREELEKIVFNNDPVQKLNIALEKLQAYATYFDAYNNYNAVLNVVFENKDSRYVPENLLSDTKEVQAEKSFDKVLKNVKLNEYAAEKMAEITYEKSKWAMVNFASLDLNQIKDHFFPLLHYHRLQEDLGLFDSLFKTFAVRADVDGEGQLKIRQREGLNFHQPLYDMVKNHIIAYYRLLLEIESNNCERELANAELMTIAIHLKKVLCEARMAIFALDEMEQRYNYKNNTLIAKKLSDETFKAIAYAYALQKIGIDRAIYKEHFFMATTKTLKSYTSELKRMADIQTLNFTQSIAKNPDLCTPTLTENVVKIQTSAEEKDAVILESISKSYNEINETLSILCDERRQRYMLKDICTETEQENRLNKNFEKETNDFDIYKRHLKMGPEAYQIAKDIKENSKSENKIGNILHSDDLPNILFDLLNLIAKYELASAKLAKLEAKHLIEQEKTAAMSENTKRPDQLVAMAHLHFKVVTKIAELVMARHKVAKLLSDFWKLGEEMKKNEEYKSAETRDAATKAFDIKKFMPSKIQWGQNTRQSKFNFAIKRAIILIKKFMVEIEVKTKADNAAYIYNHASNYCNFVALLAEYILDCYSFKNKLLNDEEKQDNLTNLIQWAKPDGREIKELRDEIMHSINIDPDDVTENRVIFPLLRELPLHKIASQNESNITVNTSQSTGVTTLKDQEKQDAENPLVIADKPVKTGSGKAKLHKSLGNLVSQMVSVNDNSSRQHGLFTKKAQQTSQCGDENARNLKQPEDLVRENTPKLVRSTQVKKDNENISYEPLNNPTIQSRDANDHCATLPFADKKSTKTETDVDLNESITKPITKPRAEKAEPKKSVFYAWLRKIAIGSIAALVIILVFGLGYYLWHYFNINK